MRSIYMGLVLALTFLSGVTGRAGNLQVPGLLKTVRMTNSVTTFLELGQPEYYHSEEKIEFRFTPQGSTAQFDVLQTYEEHREYFEYGSGSFQKRDVWVTVFVNRSGTGWSPAMLTYYSVTKPWGGTNHIYSYFTENAQEINAWLSNNWYTGVVTGYVNLDGLVRTQITEAHQLIVKLTSAQLPQQTMITVKAHDHRQGENPGTYWQQDSPHYREDVFEWWLIPEAYGAVYHGPYDIHATW